MNRMEVYVLWGGSDILSLQINSTTVCSRSTPSITAPTDENVPCSSQGPDSVIVQP